MKIIHHKFNEEENPIVRPFDYVKVKDGVYQVKIYVLIDQQSLDMFAFLQTSEFYDNFMFSKDVGANLYNSSLNVIVSKDYFPELYEEILKYECVTNPTK